MILLFAATACAGLVSGSASAPVTNNACRAELRAVEQAWLDHVGDVAYLSTLLGADFVHTLPSGQGITREQHLGYAAAHPQAFSGKAELQGLEYSVGGSAVELRASISGYVVRKTGESVKNTFFTDVFAWRDGRWQAIAAREEDRPR